VAALRLGYFAPLLDITQTNQLFKRPQLNKLQLTKEVSNFEGRILI